MPPKTPPYIHSDMPIEEYHSCAGISRSALMAFRRSPLHYWHEYLNPEYVKPDPTPEMLFGNACHTLILEPATFWDRYIVRPKLDRRTKAGKQEDYANKLEAAGKECILLNDQQYDAICEMEKAIKQNPVAIGAIIDTQIEQSLFWIDSNTQILCKARPDVWGDTYVADLKTTNDASPEAFRRDANKYGYYLQCAFIRQGIMHCTGQVIDDFVFICIEKEPPYAIGCYQIGVDILQKAEEEYLNLLGGLKICQDNDSWEAYGNQVIEMRL